MASISIASRATTRIRAVLFTCLLLLIAFASLYILFPPNLASQPWDSLEYTYSTEVDGIKVMRGNHPLGHAILFMVFSTAKQLGYSGRALPVLQITNGIVGGIILAIFYLVLVWIIKVRKIYAFAFSLILGGSYSFWFFAGTGDIYHLAILSSLLTWAALIYEITLKNRSVPILSGLLAGLSILFHQLNIVLVPAGVALILLSPVSGKQVKKEKTRRILTFLAAASAMAMTGYLLLGIVATSSLSLPRVIGWMRGYFGDQTYGRYLHDGVLRIARDTILKSVLFPPENKAKFTSHILLSFLITMMFYGLWLNASLSGRKRAILAASTLQCLITWPLILWWEPHTPKFWLLTLLPWTIGLALSFEAVESSLRGRLTRLDVPIRHAFLIIPLTLGLIFLALNGQYTTIRKDTSTFNQAFSAWMENSGHSDVLITAGDLVPQLRYWGQRPGTVNLYRSLQEGLASPDHFYVLRSEINQATCTGKTALITPAASEYISDSELSLVGVSRERLRSLLEEKALQGEVVFWYRNMFDGKLLPVYALRECQGLFGR